MKRIVYQNNDGGISVIIPAPDSNLTIEQIAAKDVPPNTDYKIVDVSELPHDREFRSAWEHVQEKIEINFDKAKKIKRQRLREERKPLLAAQDVEYLKALEVNGDTTEIIKEKKRLRDITKLVDDVISLEELTKITVEKPQLIPEPDPIIETIIPEIPIVTSETPTEITNVITTSGGQIVKIRRPTNIVVRVD